MRCNYRVKIVRNAEAFGERMQRRIPIGDDGEFQPSILELPQRWDNIVVERRIACRKERVFILQQFPRHLFLKCLSRTGGPAFWQELPDERAITIHDFVHRGEKVVRTRV